MPHSPVQRPEPEMRGAKPEPKITGRGGSCRRERDVYLGVFVIIRREYLFIFALLVTFILPFVCSDKHIPPQSAFIISFLLQPHMI